MKMGISLKINVSKIDKARLFQGQKGQYLDLTLFLDPENPSQYGDHGPITQTVSKEERAQGTQLPIIGNAKVFWSDGGQQGGYQPPQQSSQQYRQPGQPGYQPQNQNRTEFAPTGPADGDDIPF